MSYLFPSFVSRRISPAEISLFRLPGSPSRAAVPALLLIAGLVFAPALARAQTAHSGSAVNFGSVQVGSSSATMPVTFTFDSGGTIAAPAVLTLGAPNLDFTDAGTGTCTTNGTSHTYNAGDTCTVNVKFSAKFAGARNGAVVLSSASGTRVATAYVYGEGVAPQVAFSPSLTSTISLAGVASPSAVAVDGHGNIYFLSGGVGQIPAGCTSPACVKTLTSDLYANNGLAVDGTGDLYASTYSAVQLGTGFVVKIQMTGCASPPCGINPLPTPPDSNSDPAGVAVDGSGNVYVADEINWEVEEIPAGCVSSACVEPLGGGFSTPTAVAVDFSGNVYVADSGHNVVKEMPQGCNSSACVSSLGGVTTPVSIALDASGNVYVLESHTDPTDNQLKEIPSGCISAACVTTLAAVPYSFSGIAVDPTGTIYVANELYPFEKIEEFLRATPPSLTFASTPVGQTSSDSPQTVTVQNIGNADLDFTDLVYATDFPEANGVKSDCTSSTALVSSASCTLSINFSPLVSSATGPSTPLSEFVSLTDNALNAANVVQSVAVSGTATTTPYITTPSPGSVIGGNNIFTWWPGLGVTHFQLYIGTTGPGSTNVYWGPTLPGTATSSGSVYIPLNGATLYVRFWYQQNNAWQYLDYTYREGSQTPYIASPVPGTAVGGNTTFTWVSDPSVSQFQLYAGTTGPGSSDVYRGPNLPGTATSSGSIYIPDSGTTLYVRLWYLENNTWLYRDYTYIEASATPYLTSPVPGTVLSGPTIFTWYPGSGVTGFQIYAGTTGAGSSDIYRGPDLPGTATSSGAIHIPANGDTLYVRFWYQLGGSWQHQDYTYTEAGTTPVITSPAPGTVIGANTIFTWNPGPGADQFALYVGTAGPGSTDVYWGPNLPGTATSSGSVYIPLNDATLYVRFWYLKSGAWQYHDYAYREASAPPYIVTPAPGTAIGGPTTFTWNGTSTPATAYQLYVGTTGAGSSNIYRGPDLPGSASSSAPITIPTSGGIVYVRLWYQVNSAWLHQDYTYFETSATPYIIGPAPGTALGPYSIFTWWPGSGVQQFQLYAGTTGPGSTDVYWGPNLPGTATSSDAIYIPPGTTTLYLRFWYLKNNSWQHLDYTYTEAP